MRNLEIAAVLRMVADILEIRGENPFKVRAYRQAVLTLETLPEDIEKLLGEESFQGIPGIGKRIASKIEELVSTGKLKYYEDLKESIPGGLIEMLEIPNVGPKTVQALFKKLGIRSIDELEASAREGKIRGLERFGEKTEENILKGIEFLRGRSGRMMLSTAAGLADTVADELKKADSKAVISTAGSLRRRKESVGDIDILCSSKNSSGVMKALAAMPEVTRVLARGNTKSSVILENSVQADLRVVPLESFGAALQYFTGSKEHNIKLRELAASKGFKLNEYGLYASGGGQKAAGRREKDIYRKLGLDYIEPELREDRGEIEAAAAGELPELLELSDIRGDLHVHTNWSDGLDSVQGIAAEALKCSYSYVAVCDHSASLKIAGGLSKERKLEQIEHIRKLNKALKGIQVLMGAEVDIHQDGTLDYDEELLEKLDFVVAAVHTGFRQDSPAMTERIIRAMSSRFVNVIAHPTGRLINQREPYGMDMSAVIREARRTGTALELNCFPDRLDINDIHCREAKNKGVMVSLGSDCHNAKQLQVMRFGVAVARRGWLERENVLNALSARELKKFVMRKRG